MTKTYFIILLSFMAFSTATFGQSFGIGLAYATTKSLDVEFLYSKNNNNYKFGISYQIADKRGKLVKDQLSNYGQTTDGSGKYFITVDFGYGKTIMEKIQIDGELSIGVQEYYTNYLDNRFTGGGYHMVTKTETAIGIGLNAGYLINRNWCIYTGFNTLRKFQLGVRWIF